MNFTEFARQECPRAIKEVAISNPTPVLHKTVQKVEPLLQWQQDFCLAHGIFNNWRGNCPCSIDDCLISRVVDSKEDIDNLRKFEIGQGITTDMVIDEWLESGEPAEDIFKTPIWLICMAEHLTKGRQNV